jgi:hypothetical protein
MTLSASGLELAAACPASQALAQVRRPSDAYQTRGTAIHAYLEAALSGDPDALASVDEEHRAVCAGIDLARLFPPGSTLATEVPVAYDAATDTARALPRRGHRNYGSLKATDVPGTIDVVETWGSPVERVAVVDWKSGWLQVSSDSLQLAFYGLCVARLYGVDEVTVRIVQLDDAGGATVDERTLDAFDLLDVAGQVGRILERVAAARALVAAGGTPSVAMGDHCQWCNVGSCPATVGVARDVLATLQAQDVLTSLASASDEEVGALASKMLAAAPLWERVLSGIKAEVDRRGSVPLPDGRTYESRGIPRRSIDTKRALPVLQAYLGDKATGLVEQKLSLSAIEKAAGSQADDVLNALDVAGALRTKVTQTHKVCGKARTAE